MSEEVVIRRATEADLNELIVLLKYMHPEDKPASLEHIIEAFKQIEVDNRRSIIVAEECSRGVIGTLDFFYMPNLTRGARPWGGIENLVVHPDMRNQGIGKALIETALELARTVDCYKVQLVSHKRRVIAQSLYEKIGFTAPVRGYRYYIK